MIPDDSDSEDENEVSKQEVKVTEFLALDKCGRGRRNLHVSILSQIVYDDFTHKSGSTWKSNPETIKVYSTTSNGLLSRVSCSLI